MASTENTDTVKKELGLALGTQAREIKTVQDFAKFMTALMGAIAEGAIGQGQAQAICLTATTLLKIVEAQMRHTKNGEQLGITVTTEKLSVGTTPKINGPRPKSANCVDCYTQGRRMIKATETDDDDPLCLPCFNKRTREGEK